MKITSAILLLVALIAGQPQPQDQSQLTKADIDKWMTELSNWGRWGKTDELGAINLITPAKRKQALGLVKDGTTVSLARLTNTETAPDNAAAIHARNDDERRKWAGPVEYRSHRRLISWVSAHASRCALPHVLAGKNVQRIPRKRK